MDLAQDNTSFCSVRFQEIQESGLKPNPSILTLGGLLTTGGGSSRITFESDEVEWLSPGPGGFFVMELRRVGSWLVASEKATAVVEPETGPEAEPEPEPEPGGPVGSSPLSMLEFILVPQSSGAVGLSLSRRSSSRHHRTRGVDTKRQQGSKVICFVNLNSSIESSGEEKVSVVEIVLGEAEATPIKHPRHLLLKTEPIKMLPGRRSK